MKAILRITVVSLAFLACARAQEPDGSYVYLGSQTDGTSSTMVFVNNTTFSHGGNQVTAAAAWVRYPGYGDGDSSPAYFLKNDVYHCDAEKISHVRTRIYTRYGSLVSDKPENPGLAPVKANSLNEFVFKKICGSGWVVAGAENEIIKAVSNAFVVMAYGENRAKNSAHPPQSSIGYYPPGIAPVENIPVPQNGAYEIPAADGKATIWDTYRATDGHIVFYYDRQSSSSGRLDYFDTVLGRDLYPDQAHAMATSRGDELGKKLRPPGLRELDNYFFHFVQPTGKTVSIHDGAGSVCARPYSDLFMQIEVDNAPERRIALFHKLDKPEVWKNTCTPTTAIAYHAELPIFLAADERGYFAHPFDFPALVHFDWRGHSAFFSGRDTLIAVPYDELVRALGDVDEPDQAAIDRAEAVIARYDKLQLRGASPLSR